MRRTGHGPRPALVLGIGNVLLGDDGVGVRVVHELRRRIETGSVRVPGDTRLVDGGTLGAGLLPVLTNARTLVVIDAGDFGLAPGTVCLLAGESLDVASTGERACDGLGALLAAARIAGTLPERVVLVAIQPGTLETGTVLSAPVEAATNTAIALTLEAVA